MTNSRVIAPMMALLLILSFQAGSVIGPEAVGLGTLTAILLSFYCLPGVLVFSYLVRRYNFLAASVVNSIVTTIFYEIYLRYYYGDDFQLNIYVVPMFVLYFFIISIFFFSIVQIAFFRTKKDVLGGSPKVG